MLCSSFLTAKSNHDFLINISYPRSTFFLLPLNPTMVMHFCITFFFFWMFTEFKNHFTEYYCWMKVSGRQILHLSSLFELMTDLQLSILIFSILNPVKHSFLFWPPWGLIMVFPFLPSEGGSRVGPFIQVSDKRITIGTDLTLSLNPWEN